MYGTIRAISARRVLGDVTRRDRHALASRTDHEQTCLKLSARPMPDTDIVHNADVNTDINTDLLENSAPRIISDLSLFK